MCCRLTSALLIFWQAAIGDTKRRLQFDLAAETEMDSAQCVHWFNALDSKNQGMKRLSYNIWFRYFQEKGTISNTLLYGEVQPAFRDQMIAEFASQRSGTLNAVTQDEFVSWCLKYGDSFKLKHSTIEAAVDELIEVEEQLDPIKQAFLTAMANGRGGTFPQILKTLNAAAYKTSEIKDEFFQAMTQTWECLTHLGRFSKTEAVTTQEGMLDLLDLWGFAIHKEGGLIPMHNDYTLCKAWESQTLHLVQVGVKKPSKSTRRKVSSMYNPKSSYVKASSRPQGTFSSIQSRRQQFGN